LASILAMPFELRVQFPGCKTLDLAFIGCTWQWRFSSRCLVEDIVWRSNPLQDENLGFDHDG
jgi:hypothetical protein